MGSGSDAGDSVTGTSVLLGYAEVNPTSDTFSQLGGEPIWLHPNSPADSRMAKCSNCNRLMSMLLELNGAIPESPHDRMFYVFSCKERLCRRKKGCVKAIRGVMCTTKPKIQDSKPVEEKEAVIVEEKEETVNTGNFLFGVAPNPASVGSNPFSTGPAANNLNPFSSSSSPFSSAPTPPTPSPLAAPATTDSLTKSFAETLRLAKDPPGYTPLSPPKEDPAFFGPAEPWPDPLPHTYPRFYLDADYEMLETAPPPIPQNYRQMEYGVGDDMPMSGSAFESLLDKTFQKFADQVAQNPEQVLRYERGGAPLMYSKEDETGKVLLDAKGEFNSRKIPACGNCRRPGRVFEFQIMPHAISVLEGDELGLGGMEWGTIIVGTCTCVPKVLDTNGVGYVEEWVGVQWESQK